MKYFVNFINWVLAGAVTLIGGHIVANLGADMLLLSRNGIELDLAGFTLLSILLVAVFATSSALYFTGKVGRRLYEPLDQYVH